MSSIKKISLSLENKKSKSKNLSHLPLKIILQSLISTKLKSQNKCMMISDTKRVPQIRIISTSKSNSQVRQCWQMSCRQIKFNLLPLPMNRTAGFVCNLGHKMILSYRLVNVQAQLNTFI